MNEKTNTNSPIATDNYVELETELWEANPSYLYYLLYEIVGVALIIGSLFLPYSRTNVILGVSMVIIGVILLGLPISIRSSRIYTITDMRVKAKTGMLSRYIDQIFFEDIKSINLTQNYLEKLFNLGTISIVGTTNIGIEEDAEAEVVLQAIPEPQEIIGIIRDLMGGALQKSDN